MTTSVSVSLHFQRGRHSAGAAHRPQPAKRGQCQEAHPESDALEQEVCVVALCHRQLRVDAGHGGGGAEDPEHVAGEQPPLEVTWHPVGHGCIDLIRCRLVYQHAEQDIGPELVFVSLLSVVGFDLVCDTVFKGLLGRIGSCLWSEREEEEAQWMFMNEMLIEKIHIN